MTELIPFDYKSPNSIPPAKTLLAFMVSIVAGARRLAHTDWLRADKALHALLGIERFPGTTPFSPPSGPPQRLFHEHPAKSKFLAATGTHALLPNGLQGGSGHGCKTCIHQITYRVDLLAGPELDP